MVELTKLAILVGVDHRIQYANDSCGPEWMRDIRKLGEHIEALAVKWDVDLVAEEFNQQLMQTNSATECTARDAANRAGRRHLFCDPDAAERTARGICGVEAREQEWLRRIMVAGSARLLFVCGDDHVHSFAERLREVGYAATVDSREWGKGWQLKD